MANKSSNGPLAAIYGQALYEAAAEAGVLEKVASELSTLDETLKKDAKFGDFFESPTIAFSDKRKVLDEALKNSSVITRNFLLVLTEKRRSSLFSEIVAAFQAHSDKQSDVAAVEVTSARALDAGERESLLKTIGNKLGKKIKLVERINPDLIGGMIVVHGDKMWDGSLRHKLNEAMQRMESIKATAVKWS